MKVRRFKRAVQLTTITAFTVSGLLVTFAPRVAEAATFTTVPTRLYMAPAGVSIPNGIAQLVGVKVGTLEFDGSTDPISQDVRSIVVNTLTGAQGCDLTAPPYDIDDCSRLQIGPISHGRLKAGNTSKIEDGDGDPMTNGTGDDVYLLPSGARIENDYQVAKGSYYLAINGTPQQLNDAMEALVYTPDLGYYYEGSNGENVNIALIPGNGDDNLPPGDTSDDTAYATIEIRVLNVNGFPVVTGPSNKQAQAGVELQIPAVAPDPNPPFTGTQFTVVDTDNDEVVDGAQANPPVSEGALIDGAGTKMLLVGFLDCGVPTTDLTNGFHYRGGAFEVNNNDIRSIVRDFFQFTQLPPSGQAIVTTLLDGIDAIEPGLTTTMLATNDPTTYTSLFAGIGTMSDVQYALSQISFLQPAAADTCTLWTAVSDLGNNGLPLQYFGDPPTGIEVPMIGLGLDSFDINTGDLEEIDISFVDASTQYINEAGAPVDVEGQLRISPAVHPEFTIQWEVNPKNGDPEVAGIATADDDFQGTYNNTLTVPENEEFIPTASVFPDPPNTTIYPDSDVEGNESFTFDLVLNQTPPPGYFISSAVPSKTVVIVDDDDGVKSVSVNDTAVVEGDSGTTSLNFTVALSGPADGNESVTVATADGSATIADSDYVAVAPQVVTFATGEMQKTVTVTVNGDLTDELGATDETLLLNLTSPANVTISDAAGVGTIENDDQTRTVSIADASKTEGNAGTSVLNFVLSLSSPAKGNESVTVTSTDGTAQSADNDYEVLAAQPVSFVAGATTAMVSVTINGDVTPEANETFTLALGTNVNVQIGDGTATGTIQNDDGVPTVSIGDVTVTEGNAGTTSAVFTVSLGAAATAPGSVTVASSNGSATAPSDFTAVGPLTVAFDTGDTSKTVTVLVNGDVEVEVNESFTMTLSNPDQLVIGDGTAVGNITNDDITESVVSIADATVTEAGAIDQVVISMTNHVGRTCAVTVTSVNGTAVAPGDYATVTGTFNLVSLASDVLSLSVVDDPLVEVDETFTVNITLHASSDAECVLGDSQATITIVSNDLASVVSIADATVTEGAGVDQTTISMTNSTGHNCAVTVTMVDGTAVSPDDYSAGGGTFNLLAVPSDVLSLSIVDDSDVDPGETFTVSIALHASSDPACVLGDSSATILITDDDSPPDVTAPTVTINQAVGQADPTATSPVVFTATFSEPVVGFGNVAGDVVLGGTSNGAKVATVTGGPTVFTVSVAVTGATNEGTVVATIPAAAASDGVNSSLASTSTDNSVTFDQIAPTATIDQAPGQTDPTTASPIVFAVEFSEPVTGFATGDVTPTGTAGATAAAIAGSGTSYTITVTGMAVPGTVIVAVAAGVAQDLAANANAAATVIDNTVQFDVPAVPSALTISVPANIVRNNDPGKAGAVVAYPVVTAAGGTAPIVIACDVASGSFFALGTTTVSCTATDADGAVQDMAVVSGSFTVRVVDAEPPVIADLPDLTRVIPDLGAVAVTFPTPSATDNSGAAPTVVCSPASGSSFAIGVATVTCTATDGSGNQASSSFTVTVTSDGLGLGLPATGSTPQPILALALLLIGAGLLLVGYRRSRVL